MKISASLLSGRENLVENIKELNVSNIDYIHLDIMDNIFVKHSSFSDEEIEAILALSTKKLDVHLMVDNPNDYLYLYRNNVTEFITIHYESLKTFEIIDKIKEKGIKCGISIKPNTKVEMIYDLLPKLDLVLIMSVEPGMGGQQFLNESYEKIKLLNYKIKELGLNTIISVDGGINEYNIEKCLDNGANMFVIGSALINSKDKIKYVNDIKNIDTNNSMC